MTGQQQALPSDSKEVLAQLARVQEQYSLSKEAIQHIRAFSKFYLWAVPLMELGHITLHERMVEFDMLLAKRFLISTDEKGVPKLEIQPSEFQWMSEIPWAMAGFSKEMRMLVLIAKPSEPLSACSFAIPIDIPEKLVVFKDQRYLDLAPLNLGEDIGPRALRLEMGVVGEHFFTRRKRKNKL